MKIGITTIPFSQDNISLLEENGHSIKLNPFNKKIKYEQITNFLEDCEAVLAGTERYDTNILKALPKLKYISRVGVGIDNIDFELASKLNIKIANTPDEPAEGVAEYCLGIMICFFKRHSFIKFEDEEKIWNRNMSLSLADAKISLIGGGKVSKKLTELLFKCGAKNVYVTDIVDLNRDPFWSKSGAIISSIDDMLDSNIISLHLPLTKDTRDMIDQDFISKLTNKPYLINSSRGEIVNEQSLIKAVEQGLVQGAALDVFNNEPYEGPLIELNELITTPHIASTSRSVRYNMEKEVAST